MKVIKKITAALLILITSLSLSCKKNDTGPITKKTVEVKISYGPNYNQYYLLIRLQATSINGGLPASFQFTGLNTTPILTHEVDIIHHAELSPIPVTVHSIKTPVPVSSLGVFLLASPLTDIDTPLSVTLDFFIGGKKTVSASATISRSSNNYGFVLDVNNLGELIKINTP